MATVIDKETEQYRLRRWIQKQTRDVTSVVELGAGMCDRLAAVAESCTRRYAIEVFAPYLKHRHVVSCVPIVQDMRSFELALRDYAIEPECAMLIDSLQTLHKDEAIELLKRLQKRFEKILIYVKQNIHANVYDPTGFGNHNGWKRESIWRSRDLEVLGFQVHIDRDYDEESLGLQDVGALFAVWNRDAVTKTKTG